MKNQKDTNKSCECIFPPLKPRWNPPNLSRFRPENLWFEDKDGNRWTPTDRDLRECVFPPTHPYQVSRSGCEVRTTHIACKKGRSKTIMAGNATADPELVRCLVNKIDPFWKDRRAMTKALQIAAMACERCKNILAHECGLPWGYSAESPAAENTRTLCPLCKPN